MSKKEQSRREDLALLLNIYVWFKGRLPDVSHAFRLAPTVANSLRVRHLVDRKWARYGERGNDQSQPVTLTREGRTIAKYMLMGLGD